MTPGTEPTKRSRILWVDVCKGLGISAVVLGHTLDRNRKVTQFLFLFHMPLFFFISGYLHHLQPSFPAFFRKKSAHLLLPYFSFVVLLYPIEFLHVVQNRLPWSRSFLDLLWGGSRMVGVYDVFWFIPCLFLTQQVMNYLLLKLRLPAVVSICLLCLGASYLASSYFPILSFPFSAEVVPAAIPFFFCGYLCRNFLPERALWIDLSALACTAGSALLIAAGYRIDYDMKHSVYGVPFLSFALSLGCIFSVLLVSRIASSLPIAAGWIASLGASSMGIMFLHRLFLIGQGNPLRRHPWVGALVVLVVTHLLTWLMSRFRISRALLLGSEADCASLRWTGQVQPPMSDRPSSDSAL